MRICRKAERKTFTRHISLAIAPRGIHRSSARPRLFYAPIWAASANGKHPFRFIWNRSDATAHNVYLMLYPKSRLQEALNNHPELAARVFEALQSVTPGQFISEGRVYGGGLHKVEPKELAQIPARGVLESIDGHFRIERQEKLFA